MGNVETPHGSSHKNCSCEKICHTRCSETLSLLGPSSQTGAAHLGLGRNSLRSNKTLSWENKKYQNGFIFCLWALDLCRVTLFLDGNDFSHWPHG